MHVAMLLQAQPLNDTWARIQDMGVGAESLGLNLGLAIVIGLIGWGLATLVAWIVGAVLRRVRFDDAVTGLFGRTPSRYSASALASWSIYWILIGLSAMLALDTFGFRIGASVGERLVEILPRIFVSTTLLVIGVLFAVALGAVTRRLFESAGIRGARVRGQGVTAVLSAFAVLIALEQLGFAATFVMTLGIAVVASIGLAFGLSFGLGCRDLARDFVIEYLRSQNGDGGSRPRP